MREAAGDLALDQFRVDRLADVIGDDIALDLDRAGVGIDADGGDVDAVGIDHVGGFERILGAQPGEIAERHRRAAADAHDLAVDDIQHFRCRLH